MGGTFLALCEVHTMKRISIVRKAVYPHSVKVKFRSNLVLGHLDLCLLDECGCRAVAELGILRASDLCM